MSQQPFVPNPLPPSALQQGGAVPPPTSQQAAPRQDDPHYGLYILRAQGVIAFLRWASGNTDITDSSFNRKQFDAINEAIGNALSQGDPEAQARALEAIHQNIGGLGQSVPLSHVTSLPQVVNDAMTSTSEGKPSIGKGLAEASRTATAAPTPTTAATPADLTGLPVIPSQSMTNEAGQATTVAGLHATSQTRSDPAYLARALGMSESQLRREYDASQRGFRQAQGRLGQTTGEGQSYGSWIADQVRALEGQAQYVLNTYEAAWTQDHGTPMPAELRSRLLNELNSMPLSERSRILATTMASVTGSTPLTSSPSPRLDHLVQAFETGHPDADSQAAAIRSGLIGTLTKALGTPPDEATVDRILAMPEADRQQAIDNLNMPGTHLTVGQYDMASQKAQSVWSKNFNKPPTKADIERIASFRSDDEMNAWVGAQPSYIQGVNIKTYGAYHDLTDNLRSKLWNVGTDKDFIQFVHGAVSKGAKGG